MSGPPGLARRCDSTAGACQAKGNFAWCQEAVRAKNPVGDGLPHSSLQGTCLIIAARALGLDRGPMSGFDAARLEAEFFSENGGKADIMINLGYADPEGIAPAQPASSLRRRLRTRLTFRRSAIEAIVPLGTAAFTLPRTAFFVDQI